MMPMRTSSIFKSRWMVLLWAAGLVWLAVRAAAPAENTGNSDVTGATISDDDLKKFADFAERK